MSRVRSTMPFFLAVLALASAGCVLVMPRASACDDGLLNGEETDLDCGGSVCGPCAQGKLCLKDGDCASKACANHLCVAASCTDGVKNGDETDVDCGGACGACAEAKACAKPADCASGQCAGGQCVAASCADGAKNGAEVDVDCGGTCGACANGKACRLDADCQSGACVDGTCGGGCGAPLRACGASCVDPLTDHAHCGDCATACAANQACVGGHCTLACHGGTLPCGGACVDIGSNPAHCGGCNQPCAAGTLCQGGLCVPPCGAGQTACGAECVSFDFDRLHCGGCTTTCGTGTTCVAGQCTAACPAPLQLCGAGATCVDPLHDPQACGGCGQPCPALPHSAPACANGQCVLGACQPPFADCNQLPGDGCEADLTADPSNCGICGLACGAGNSCSLGACCGGPLPGGSYSATCTGCEVCGPMLRCTCQNVSAQPVQTFIPTPTCMSGTFKNCNGVLTCDTDPC